MEPAERNYEIHDRELLAVIKALKEWRAELIGLRNFEALTDHQALQSFAEKKQLNARQIRWSMLIPGYHFTIKYRLGKANVLADVVSRKDLANSTSTREDRNVCLLPERFWEQQPQPKVAALTQMESVVPRVIKANQQHDSLEEMREKAKGDKI